MNTRLVAVDEWLGRRAAPLEPSSMEFRARLAAEGAGDCAGCIFRGQASTVCKAAAAAAQLAGLQDCDEREAGTSRTYVYYEIKTDPRQMRIETGE